MRRISVNATMLQSVYVDLRDAVLGIKKELGFSPRDGFIRVRDGELQYGEDVSYHGSPMYEYKTISDNPKWIDLYNSIKCLEEYIDHSKEPQWEKMLAEDMEEDESGPVMGM